MGKGFRAKVVLCSICGRKNFGHGLCSMHYQRQRRRGGVKPLVFSQRESFESRVQKTNSCWLWIGKLNRQGYGMMLHEDGREIRAHRYSYEIHKGPIPEGLHILHSCDNPRCVNPDHLRAGTREDNMEDAVSRRRMPSGPSHHATKLTTEQIQAIRVATGTQREIGARFGISQAQVSRIRLRQTRKYE